MSNILNSKNTDQVKKDRSHIKSELLFRKNNYIILIVAIFSLFLGFILLSGGGSEDYTYNKEIFNFQRRVLAPIIIIIALILCGISIMSKKS